MDNASAVAQMVTIRPARIYVLHVALHALRVQDLLRVTVFLALVLSLFRVRHVFPHALLARISIKQQMYALLVQTLVPLVLALAQISVSPAPQTIIYKELRVLPRVLQVSIWILLPIHAQIASTRVPNVRMDLTLAALRVLMAAICQEDSVWALVLLERMQTHLQTRVLPVLMNVPHVWMAFLAHFVLILALITTKNPACLNALLEPMEIIARVFPLVCLVRTVLRHVKMEDLAIARQVNVIALAQALLV